MTDHKITLDALVLVAIDISKHRHEILIEVPGKKRRRRLTIQSTRGNYDRLTTLLTDYRRPIRIAFEATGNYHRVLAHHLGQAGFELKLVSSVALARTREALINSWDKNDPKDAQVAGTYPVPAFAVHPPYCSRNARFIESLIGLTR
jgi:transposase